MACPELIARLDRAVDAGSTEAITREVKLVLEQLPAEARQALREGTH